MGVDIFMKPVFRKNASTEIYVPKDDDEITYLARSHRINSLVRDDIHVKLIPSDLKFEWLDKQVALNEIYEKLGYIYPMNWELADITQDYVFDPIKILLDLEVVHETIKNNNDKLPSRYRFALERNRNLPLHDDCYEIEGIKFQKFATTSRVSVILNGILWQFEGAGWDHCIAYPRAAGENSPNRINYAEQDKLPILECYENDMEHPEYGKVKPEALERYERHDLPDKLTIQRESYFDFQKRGLGYMMDVCKYAIKHEAKICFFISY